MLKGKLSIEEAAELWFGQINVIPMWMFSKIYYDTYRDWEELTKPKEGTIVCLKEVPKFDIEFCHYNGFSYNGEILAFNQESNSYSVLLDDDVIVSAEEKDFLVCRDNLLPIQDGIYSFKSVNDSNWVKSEAILHLMSDLGFRIFQYQDAEIFFGLDYISSNMIKNCYVPLYQARGLCWHDDSLEESV